jgi:hypothetical protein
MNKFKIWVLPLLLILALVWAGCEKKGEPVAANIPPDTRILSYSISSAAEKDTSGNPTTDYAVTVYWAGSDVDGTIWHYQYSTTTTFNDTVFTTASQRDFVFDFADAASEYTVYVRAIDNDRVPDPTPAMVTIKRDFAGVETNFVDGPPNGAVVGTGISYKIAGTTATGKITQIEYKLNETATWDMIAADDLGQATINFTGLTSGANTVYFRAVRDDGKKDETPLSMSVVARVGEFKPTIKNTSPVSDGGGWFKGIQLTFSWTVEARYYYGSLPATPYTFEVGPAGAAPASWNLSADADSALASGWVSDASVNYVPDSTNNVFYLKVRDLGGSVDTMRIGFVAASFAPTMGILVVNGVDPGSYGSEITDRIDAGVYWGSLSVDFYDLFDAITPPAGVDYVGGGSQLSPDLMKDYSTIVWLGNNYNGDIAFWQSTPILAYLQAGGNLVFAGRFASDFFAYDQGLVDYMNITWITSGQEYEATIKEFKSVFPGLVDLTPFTGGMSYTDVFSSYGFIGANTAYDDTVTNWDGVTAMSKDEYTTLLFAHRSNIYNPSYPMLRVRGMGMWRHPNFAFSSLGASNEFPSAPEEKKGNAILIMGRNYRYDMDATKTDFEFILRNMCGEQ